MGEDDAALVVAVGEGSERAFNALVDRHQQAVRAFLRGLTNPAEADDIAQETFIAAWSQARSFRGNAGARSWLLSIAWRKAKGTQRSWFRSRRRDTAWAEAGENITSALPETRAMLAKALALLSLDQRAVVMLCLAQGFTHAEAAEALGLPLGTVKSHVTRGRDRLREVLGED